MFSAKDLLGISLALKLLYALDWIETFETRAGANHLPEFQLEEILFSSLFQVCTYGLSLFQTLCLLNNCCENLVTWWQKDILPLRFLHSIFRSCWCWLRSELLRFLRAWCTSTVYSRVRTDRTQSSSAVLWQITYTAQKEGSRVLAQTIPLVVVSVLFLRPPSY